MDTSVLILYGSQKGSSYDAARRLYRDFRRLGWLPTLSAMDSYPIEQLPKASLIFFVCSTTGQGQPPDNMLKTWQFLLRADLPSNVLQNVKFGVFGLGDSSYPMYNAVARRLDRRLQTLGAKQICPLGLGDDQHSLSYDGGFIMWKIDVFEALLSVLNDNNATTNNNISILKSRLQSALDIEKHSLTADSSTETNPVSSTPTDSKETLSVDYLSGSSIHLGVIRHDNYDSTEFDSMLSSSTYLQNIIWNSYANGCKDTNIVNTQRLLTQNDFIISQKIFHSYLDNEITLGQFDNYFDLEIPSLYSPDVISLYDYYQTNEYMKQSSQLQPQKIQNQLPHLISNVFQPISLTTTNKLVSNDNSQHVHHISCDLTPLLNNEGKKLCQKDNINQRCNNPPYLPGDVLSVIAPSPNILVNTLLTLYNLHPNDIICILNKPINFESNNDSNEQLFTEYSGIMDFLEDVMEIAEHQLSQNDNYDEDDSTNDITISSQKSVRYGTFPLCIRAWQLFTWYLQTTFVPQRHHFFMFAQQATNLQEKERLADFCTAGYASTLESYCTREMRSIVEVFADFPSSLLPLHWLIEICDRPKSRQFSLASSSLYDCIDIPFKKNFILGQNIINENDEIINIPLSKFIPSHESFTVEPQYLPKFPFLSNNDNNNNNNNNNITNDNITSNTLLSGSLCLATVKYTTPFRRQKYGLCSTYLEQLATQDNNLETSDLRNDGFTLNYPLSPLLLQYFASDVISIVSTSTTISQPIQKSVTSKKSSPRIMACIEPGSFRYNITTQTSPILAIGPGTGIAALHAIVEHRLAYFIQNAKHQGNLESIFSFFNNPSSCIPMASRHIASSSTPKQQYISPYNISTSGSETTILKELPSKPSSTQQDFHLVFGCRSNHGDHFYRDFFNYCVTLGVITQYQAVFSRNRTPIITDTVLLKQCYEYAQLHNIDETQTLYESSQRQQNDRYVQHRLLAHKELSETISSILSTSVIADPNNDKVMILDTENANKNNGQIIIAGNAKRMPVDVQDAMLEIELLRLRRICKDNGQQCNVEWKKLRDYITLMAKQGRYILECWM